MGIILAIGAELATVWPDNLEVENTVNRESLKDSSSSADSGTLRRAGKEGNSKQDGQGDKDSFHCVGPLFLG
jgi:hypothetical protein